MLRNTPIGQGTPSSSLQALFSGEGVDGKMRVTLPLEIVGNFSFPELPL